MIEIGAGGGSIARVDALGLLARRAGLGGRRSRARPATASAAPSRPSPTPTWCSATSTPAYFLGGRMALDLDGGAARDRGAGRDAARAVASRRPPGASTRSSTRTWRTPRACTPSSAAATRAACRCSRSAAPGRCTRFGVARALGAPAVIAPFGAGVMSAVGFLAAPLAFDFVRTRRGARSTSSTPREVEALLRRDGGARARRLLRRRARPRSRTARIADMRYVGQGHELRVDVPAGRRRPTLRGRVRGGVPRLLRPRAARTSPVEAINWRVRLGGPRPRLRARRRRRPTTGERAEGRARRLSSPSGRPRATPVYDRYRLAPGHADRGPGDRRGARVDARRRARRAAPTSTSAEPRGGRWR